MCWMMGITRRMAGTTDRARHGPRLKARPKTHLGHNESLRDRMGRTPAEIAEGYWEGGMQIHRGFFPQLVCSAATKPYPQKAWIMALTLNIPDDQVENATAPSAGGSPAADDSGGGRSINRTARR